jgi:hypothetical protein
MTSSIVGCIYNVTQSINEEDILEVLSNQNGDKVIRLARFNKESIVIRISSAYLISHT